MRSQITWITLKIVAFYLECCCVHSLKRKLAVFFPPSVKLLSVMLRSRAVMYPERDTFDFSQGHVTKNQPLAVPL